MNLLVWLSLGKKVLIRLWELRKERDFRTKMGIKEKAKFLGSIHFFVQSFLE
jgi:hypothetical protein